MEGLAKGYLGLCLFPVLGMGHYATVVHPVLASSFSLSGAVALLLLALFRVVAGDVAFARPEARSLAHKAKVNELESTLASRAKLVFTGNEGVSSRLSSTVCLWCLGRLLTLSPKLEGAS